MDRKAERRAGFLRRRKAKQNSKAKRMNRQKREELKYKEIINAEKNDNGY